MSKVLWSAAIGVGVALVAFLIDWLADRLDTPEEPEPLWPASKPYSRTTTYWGVDAPDLVDRNFLNPTPETWKLP